MYEYSDNLREEEDGGEGVEGGTMSLLNYWKDNNYEDNAVSEIISFLQFIDLL